MRLETRKRAPVQSPRRKQHDFDSTSKPEKLNLAPSLDLDNETMEMIHHEEFTDVKNLREYVYNAYCFLEDFEENKLAKKMDNLHKYNVWKMKKWVTKYKR